MAGGDHDATPSSAECGRALRGSLTNPGAQPISGVQWDQVSETLDSVSGGWRVTVLRYIAAGYSRPLDLLNAINSEEGNRLAPKVMFEVISHLSKAGLIGRTALGGRPRQVRYWLTGKGREILTAVSKLGSSGLEWMRPVDGEALPPVPGIDITVPNPARIWNFTLGGKDHFAADREAAGAVLRAMPSLAAAAQLTRQYQADAVRFLINTGVRQFLDIGTGLPVAGAVHQIAQQAAPESRVVYVDNDPAVLMHARALLKSSPEGACDYIQADLREPGRILDAAAATLDLDQPTAVILLAVLHFIADEDDPQGIVRRLADGIRGPAYLVVGHAAAETSPEEADAASREYNARSPVPVRLRTHEEVSGFFAGAGMTVLPPGLLSLGQWWSLQAPQDPAAASVNGHVGIGYRPAAGVRDLPADPAHDVTSEARRGGRSG